MVLKENGPLVKCRGCMKIRDIRLSKQTEDNLELIQVFLEGGQKLEDLGFCVEFDVIEGRNNTKYCLPYVPAEVMP